MTKKEVELIKEFEKLESEIEYMRGVAASASTFLSIQPSYYDNCLKAIKKCSDSFKAKFYELLEEDE